MRKSGDNFSVFFTACVSLLSIFLVFTVNAMAAKCSSIVFAHINIDGNFNDWAGIEPIILDDPDDVFQGSIADFTKVYLAQDNSYLYVRFTMRHLLNELVNPWFDVHVEFIDSDDNSYFVASHFYSGPNNGWVEIFKPVYSQLMSYPATFATYSGYDVEYKVLLTDLPFFETTKQITAHVLDASQKVNDFTEHVAVDCTNLNYTGWWYDKNAPGTGVSIEFTDDREWFLAWYVYDQNGGSNWYTASGNMLDARNFSGDLMKWQGWAWGEAYKTPESQKVGTIRGVLSGTDGKKINLTWELDDIGTGNIELTNFMADMVSGESESRDITGWWYDPAYNGMGFFIEARGETLFMAWYRYENDGSTQWLTSSGNFPNDSSVYDGSLSLWQDGQIPGGEYKQPKEQEDQGHIHIQFQSDSSAKLTINEAVTLDLKKFFSTDSQDSFSKGCIEITYVPTMFSSTTPYVKVYDKDHNLQREILIQVLEGCMYEIAEFVGCWKNLTVNDDGVLSLDISIDDTDFDAEDYYYPADQCK